MAKKRSKATTSQQINLLLEKATEQFSKGKKSVIFRLPNRSEKFFNKLRRMAYDKYCYTVKKKIFNRVQILNGIVYEYPF